MYVKQKRSVRLLSMRYSDGGAQPPAEPVPVGATPPAPQDTPPESISPAQKTEKPDYKAMYAQDKDFQGFVDGVVTKATQTAVNNALQKQQRLNDAKLSESERLREMTADQRASYWEQKAKDAENARIRDKEIESLKSQTAEMFTKESIPPAFMDIIDFHNATAEDITERVKALAEFEYYPKGELDKRVAAAVNEKLKQAAPESRGSAPESQPKDLNSALSEYYKK